MEAPPRCSVGVKYPTRITNISVIIILLNNNNIIIMENTEYIGFGILLDTIIKLFKE